MIMVICGDFIELDERNFNDANKTEEISDLEHIQWKFTEGSKIPSDILSLYTVDNGKIIITDIRENILQGIKNSKYSRVSAHIQVYEEMLIIFFEFAIQKSPNEFEIVHFGLVPATDFFTALKPECVIKIRDEEFLITEYRINKILDVLKDFETRFPG